MTADTEETVSNCLKGTQCASKPRAGPSNAEELILSSRLCVPTQIGAIAGLLEVLR